jgi:MFS family permease
MSLRQKVIQLNSIITFLGFLDTHLLIPIIALYATSLGSDIGTVGLVIGLYSVTNIITNILGGRWIDKFGYKAPLIIGLCGDAIAMLAYTLCQVPWHLALVRVFHGFSGGLVGPATMSIMAKYAQPDGKGRAMSFYGAALAASTLIGYGAGGAIASGLGYHFLFYIGSFLLFIGAILAAIISPGESSPTSEIKTSSYNLKDVMGLIKRGKLSISYTSIFAQYFSFGGVVALLPLYVATLGMEVFHVGMLLAIFSLMFIIVQFLGGKASDRRGRLKPAAIGLSLGIIALILIPLSQNFPVLAIVMALYGIGYGVLFPSVSALVVDYAVPEEYGIATGLFHALITVGVAVGAPIIGWIASFTGVRIGLAIIFVIFIPALVITLINLREKRANTIAS